MRRRRHAERFQPRAQPADVVLHHRPEIGVQHHRRQPLEFAELGRDLVAGRDEGVGHLLAQDFYRALLVIGADEAVEEGHGDGLHVRRFQGTGGGAHPRLVERHVDLAGVAQALGHLQPEIAGHQGQRLVGLDVVEIGSLLAADLEQVAEAIGGHQAGLYAAMLDQRVGRNRGAVAEVDDRRGRAIVHLGRDAAHALLHALGDAARGIVGRRRHLPCLDTPGLFIEEADIGEGPAGIDTDTPPRQHDVARHFIPYARNVSTIARKGWASRTRLLSW